VRIAVVGASGRMGRAIVRLAREGGDDVVCAVGVSDVGQDAGELAGMRRLGVTVTSDVSALSVARADAVIDFSSPAAVPLLCETAARARTRIVCGTTGLDDAARRALDAASKHVAVLWEPNMSIGVHLLGELVKRAVAALGEGYDVEIVEAHHKAKVDAPSGTALRLAEIAQATRAGSARGALVHGRSGRPGARPAGEIGMHALRGGDVIGDHTVHLLGAGERVELTHRATSRDVFAHGALRAARWIAAKPPGRYALADLFS
jgi:4-hydroxy-tetrahydrodipicolinate reductase